MSEGVTYTPQKEEWVWSGASWVNVQEDDVLERIAVALERIASVLEGEDAEEEAD